MPKWIRFDGLGSSKSGKTQIWHVVAIRHKIADTEQSLALGKIQWYGPWRKYCFFPFRNTIFEQTCLTDIAQFCLNASQFQQKGKNSGG